MDHSGGRRRRRIRGAGAGPVRIYARSALHAARAGHCQYPGRRAGYRQPRRVPAAFHYRRGARHTVRSEDGNFRRAGAGGIRDAHDRFCAGLSHGCFLAGADRSGKRRQQCSGHGAALFLVQQKKARFRRR